MLKAGFIEEGVPEEAISIICDEVEAVEFGLNMAQEGDLLVVFGDDSARCWKQIIYFNQDKQPEQEASPQQAAIETPQIEDIVIDDETLIRDERGVRLARGQDEDSD